MTQMVIREEELRQRPRQEEKREHEGNSVF
jgi:hypothetical protein